MKTIEVLYPEFQNVYADSFNIKYLSECNKNIKVIYTHVEDTPSFINHKVDMVYMGSMSDSKIIPAIKFLTPYKDKIKELIDNNTIFLVTGNAIEIFAKEIIENNQKEEGLGIFDYTVEKDFNNRIVSWYIGYFKKMKIIGHKNQFSTLKNIKYPFLKTKEGVGSELDTNKEGIHYKSFYATYNLGPFLIYNPKFTKYLLKELGLKDNLKYETDIMNAYQKRCEELKQMDNYIMGDKG